MYDCSARRSDNPKSTRTSHRDPSSPDSELVPRLFTHHVGTPGWTPHEFDVDFADPRQVAERPGHLLDDDRSKWAPQGGQRHRDQHVAAFGNIGIVDEPQIDDVDPDFRVVHILEIRLDFFFGKRNWHLVLRPARVAGNAAIRSI